MLLLRVCQRLHHRFYRIKLLAGRTCLHPIRICGFGGCLAPPQLAEPTLSPRFVGSLPRDTADVSSFRQRATPLSIEG